MLLSEELDHIVIQKRAMDNLHILKASRNMLFFNPQDWEAITHSLMQDTRWLSHMIFGTMS